jgi:hypothetical protein
MAAQLIVAAMLAATPLQSPTPDFSGTWGLRAGADASPAELYIAQDRTTLTIEQRGDRVDKFVYRLDGVAVNGDVPVPGGIRPATFRSAWKAGRLFTTIVTRGWSGEPLTFLDVRYLDEDGSLIVEILMPDQKNVRRAVYARKKIIPASAQPSGC